MTSVQDRLVALVSSAPADRRDVDIEIAIPWLRKKSELLQSLEKDTLKDVIRNCGYQKAGKDDVIINQGDIGDCFYIMLTGRTSVYIDTAKSDDDPTTDKDKESQQQPVQVARKASVIDNLDDDDEDDENKNKKKSLNRNQFGKFIMYFDAGQSFGEIALISDNCIRNATIISDMETDLLVIHKNLFNTYMKASQMAEYEEKKNFIEKCSLFRGWNAKFRHLLEMSLRKEVFPYGSVIVKQGAPVAGLTFILSGQAKLMMEPSRHRSQYSELMKEKELIPRNNKKHEEAKEERHRRHHREPVTSAQIGVRRKLGYAAAERRIMSKTVDVCCIEKDEIIGDVEMVLELDTNMETVVSTASTTVLILNTKNYERLVAKKQTFTVTRLIQGAYNKILTRARSAKGNGIPLFHSLETELKEKLPRPPPPAKRVAVVKKKEIVTGQLLDLFLQDKAPFIEPCVPNSLFYRLKSAQKNKILMENPYAQLRTLKHIEDFGKIRRKVPRSIQQLKNNIEAERELLGDNRREAVENTDEMHLHLPSRPVTSVGFSRQGQHSNRSGGRPKSAYSQPLKIIECLNEHDGFTSSSAHPDNADRLDPDTIAEIYEEMEQVNRENLENRMRLICSATAKNEFKTKLERSKTNSDTAEVDSLLEGECYDWETSENNLKDLENRVASFCRSVTPSRSMSGTSRPSTANQIITEMKRFQVDDPSDVPLPGGTVFVHKKLCKFPRASHVSPGLHKHVRRFILSREPVWTRITPAATSINY